MDNLNKFYNEGITDQNQIRKMAGYDTADQRKKDIIDAFSQARTVSGQEGWFNELASGRSVFNPVNLQNPDYRLAKTRHENVKSAMSLTDSDISSQYRSGNISPQVMNDLQRVDPVKYANVLKLNQVNK